MVTLTRATIKDIQTLLEIEKTTIGLRVYSRWNNKKEIKERLDREAVYFIKNGEVIVGSISYEIKDKNHADISALVIKPKFQKQGLAKQAMGLLLEELRDFKKISLEVHPDNHSVELYKSFGFVERLREENYFGDGEPRLIMIKN